MSDELSALARAVAELEQASRNRRIAFNRLRAAIDRVKEAGDVNPILLSCLVERIQRLNAAERAAREAA